MTTTDQKREDNVTSPSDSSTIEQQQKVIRVLIEESQRDSSFSLIQKLTAKFAEYIEDNKIATPHGLLARLKDDDPGMKLTFVKMYVAPRKNELASLIQAEITLPSEQLAKCVRYLNAMIDVALA